MTDMLFQNVSKAFGEKKVITDFSEKVRMGECVLFRGPSGCGKTTLLRLAAGLETPESGTVRRPEGSIGYVFQENRLIEFLSAEKNLLLVCKTQRQKEKAQELLSCMGLSAQDKKPVSAYSGGMKRRVAIARAILTAPKLLLLDEPFTGLDAENRRIAAEALLAGREERVTLLVSHDEDDGKRMRADRIRDL